VKLDISGREAITAPLERVWASLNDPQFLTRCIPGCRSMRELAPDKYAVHLDLKVASVGGSFQGQIALSDKAAPERCRIAVWGSGTLGHGSGEARFTLEPAEGGTLLAYDGTGEIGGLVAGVGQRVLRGVSRHLIGKFFKAIRSELEGEEVSDPPGLTP
jgi:carbon monoxide dehydrogenase subunit G